jgi:hypothetical protein
MTVIVVIAALALVAWGFVPAIKALTDACWPDEQRLAYEEWTEVQAELDRIDQTVIQHSMNCVRANLGLHVF